MLFGIRYFGNNTMATRTLKKKISICCSYVVKFYRGTFRILLSPMVPVLTTVFRRIFSLFTDNISEKTCPCSQNNQKWHFGEHYSYLIFSAERGDGLSRCVQMIDVLLSTIFYRWFRCILVVSCAVLASTS